MVLLLHNGRHTILLLHNVFSLGAYSIIAAYIYSYFPQTIKDYIFY